MRISDWSSDVCSSDLLQHAVMHLRVEGQDVTAEVGEHAVADQRRPEGCGVRRPDVALEGAAEAVDREHRLVADHQLGSRLGMAGAGGLEPFGSNMAQPSDTTTRGMPQTQQSDAP